MAQRRNESPSGDEKLQAPRSGVPYGEKRGYGEDNGEAEQVADAMEHGARPEPPRERGTEYFEEQD